MPFDWGYADDNKLIYVDTSADGIKAMVDTALDEALDDVKSEVVDETISTMDIKLEGENLLYRLLVKDEDKGEINIPKDQFLKSASYDKDNKKLIFVMETTDGEKTTEVSINELVEAIEEKNNEQDTVLENINAKDVEQDSEIASKADKADVDAELDKKAVKTEVEAAMELKADKTELEPLATKEELAAVDAKVDAIVVPDVSGFALKSDVDAAMELKADKTELEPLAKSADVASEIAAAVEPLATKEELSDVDAKFADYATAEAMANVEENKVGWTKSTEDRKHIVLANHDSILGTATDGTTYNVAMVSKWDVADFGSAHLHLNLNTKDGIATINDNEAIATESFVGENVSAAVDGLAKQSDVDDAMALKADKTDVSALEEALNAEAQRATNAESELMSKDIEIDAKVDAKADKSELEPLATKEALAEEAQRATDKESEINTALGLEVERASGAETVLKDRIDGLDEAKVGWVESTPGRKHIVLANHDSILGTSTDGGTYNVAMLSKWDVADFGSAQLHINLNTSDNVTVNDDKVIATEQWVDEQGFLKEHQDISSLATKAEVEEAAANAVAQIVASAPEDFDTLKEVADYIASDKTKASEIETKLDSHDSAIEAINAKDAEQDETIALKADKSELPSIEGLAKASDVTAEIESAVAPLATKEEIASKVDWVESTPGRNHIVLKNHDSLLGTATDGTTYNVAMVSKWDVADFGSTSLHLNLNTKDGMATINDDKQIATTDDVNAVDAKVDALEIPSIEGLASEDYVDEKVGEKADASELAALALVVNSKPNTSDIPTKTSELTNDSGFITSHQSLEDYASKAYVSGAIAEVVGAAPETLDTLGEIANALADNATMTMVSEAISTKANSDDVYTKGEIDNKIGNLGEVVEVEGQKATYWEDGDELPEGVEVGDVKTPAVDEVKREKSVKEYVDESVQTVNEKPEVMVLERKYGALLTLLNLRDTDINNTIVNQELAESNAVTYEDGSIDNIVVPETTKSKTITAELEPDTDLTLTSRYGVTINNTSEEATNLNVTAPAVENYNAATITLNGGEYDTITVTDASLTVQNGASVQNVVITQETTKNLTVNAMFAEGATVTSSSNAAITLTSKNGEGEEVSVVLDAPGATVTMNNGNWVNVEAAVSANTLIINKNVHIENLNVTQGNVTVKVARQEDIANVVENYTLAEGYTIDYLHDDITSDNVAKLTSEGTHTLIEDISKSGRFAPGMFASDDIIWNLNGHNITFTNTQGYANFLLRGSLHLEINGEGNVINNAGDYGFWAAAEGVKIVVNGGHFEAATHVLYAEKGTIEVNGGSFKLTNPDECDKDVNGNFKFLLNCKDENYTAGKANIIVRGGKFYDFNPAVTYGEPNSPVSYVPEGYTSVESTETIDGVEHRVYTVKKA